MSAPTRRQFFEISAAAASSAALAGMVGCGKAGRAAVSRPNLLFVFPDRMRGQVLGFLGEDPVITPNLDRFAAEGMALTQAAVNDPVCSPYRAMMLTGLPRHIATFS